ncbi:hypothetical protein DENSPDRAFT_849624 [Dentipellis sp. KUC8613]|nr:hypothetical protein DENSPDRAFT_849624 [Dentipellis sp. KUC8613]
MSSAGLSPSDVEDFDFANLSDSPLQQHSETENTDTMSQTIAPSRTFFEPVDIQMAEQTKTVEELTLATAPMKHHARFYFDDGNVEFLVQDTLYRVHRYFFCRDSPLFVDLLAQSDAHPGRSAPVLLDDVEPSEFDAFLSILYPAKFHECDVTTVEGWTSVLRLATKWSFSSIRTLSIERLESIASPIDKVVLGRTYGVDSWVIPGLVALCERPQSLARDEGRKLGVDDVIVIAAVREVMRSHKSTAARRPTRDKVQGMIEARLASHEGSALLTVEPTVVDPRANASKTMAASGDNGSAENNDSGSGNVDDYQMSTPDENTVEKAWANKLLELKKKAEEAESVAMAKREEEAVTMKVAGERERYPRSKHTSDLYAWSEAKFRVVEASAAARWAEHEAKLRAEALAAAVVAGTESTDERTPMGLE